MIQSPQKYYLNKQAVKPATGDNDYTCKAEGPELMIQQ